MRINRIQLQKFKCFETYKLDLNPRFALLVGDNGSEKPRYWMLWRLQQESGS